MFNVTSVACVVGQNMHLNIYIYIYIYIYFFFSVFIEFLMSRIYQNSISPQH
jgi:hypothetical protein